jgi:hypothetical protein
MSRDQNAGQNGNIQIGNKSFETVEQCNYLETIITNRNSIHEEIKSRPKSGNSCCHSEQNLLPSSLLSKNIQIKIYRTIILPGVLYVCETWSLTLREESRQKVLENRAKEGRCNRGAEKTTSRETLCFVLHDKYYSGDKIEMNERGGACSTYGGKKKRYMDLLRKSGGRRPHERHRHRWEDNIKIDLRKVRWGHGLDRFGSG